MNKNWIWLGMSDIAIKVENLSKYYKLGVIDSGTLSRDLQSWLWKKIGKEDPNRKIGTHEDNADGFWALKDLNFEIRKGDRVGVIGKNGAGKSTLLKMISQISAPTEGRIYINGKVASLLEVGTGFNPELTGRENIYLNGAILGMKKREVDAKIDEIIAFSEIDRHIDTPVKRYSSGMYVKLAFAVAAHLDSDILIADEVLAVGDAAFQKKALGKMNELSSGQGRTVLFVSHNMGAVRNLCSSGLLLSNGHLIKYEYNIEDVIQEYLIDSGSKSSEWKNNESNKYSGYFVPVSMKIENLDSKGIISSSESIKVKIIFKVDNIDTSMYWGISLRNEQFERLFLVSPYEEISEYTVNKGINICTCEIPANLLNAGRFCITLESSSRGMRCWFCNPYEGGPSIFFTSVRNSEKRFGNTNSLLPYCNWRVENE